MRSSRRPGVATTRSTPRSSVVDLPAERSAAEDGDGLARRRRGRAARARRAPARPAHGSARAPGRAASSGASGDRTGGSSMRQAEGQRLAGAGLRATEDVVAGQAVGQGRGLDREGGADVAALERRDELLREPELAERGLGRHRVLGGRLLEPGGELAVGSLLGGAAGDLRRRLAAAGTAAGRAGRGGGGTVGTGARRAGGGRAAGGPTARGVGRQGDAPMRI